MDSSMDSSMEPSMEPPDPVPSSSQKSGIAPEAMLADAIARGAFHATTRRGFLAAGGMAAAALALVGCTPTRNTALPGGRWASTDDLPPGGMQECPAPAPPVPNPAGRDVATILAGGGPAALPYAKPRRFWARGEPELSVLNPMLPVHAITVHHDGLDILETGTAERAMMARLELYRVGHRAKGWGDIGYHLVIDRAGELWQGRSIRWQGAHVKDHNEGNIGVLVMGNFERQRPTAAQVKTLEKTLVDLMSTYRVRRGSVYTHREWPSAKTACPGRNLQTSMIELRRGSRLA